jgi:hypothetical protein
LEGSFIDNGTILLTESSDWVDILDVLVSGMIGSGRTQPSLSSIPGVLRMS